MRICKDYYYSFLITNTNTIPFSAPPKALLSTEKFEGNFVPMAGNITQVKVNYCSQVITIRKIYGS